MQEVAKLRSLFIPGKNLLKRSFWAFTVLSLGTVAMSSGQGKAASGKGILILGTDSDVWAWERTIEGKYYCPGEVQSITVEVNGNSVTAKWQAGEFEATIPLDDGINEVVAVCQLSDGTEYRSNTLTLTQKLVDKPRAQVDIQVTDRGILLTGANSQVGHGGSPITQYVWEISPRENPGSLYLVGSKEPLEQAEGSTLKLESPTIDGEYYITMTAIDQQGRKDSSRTYFVARDGKPQVANFDKEQPNWVKSLVIYGVMPHYFGLEGLKSVIERLDYLQELGVNALWISPIYDTFYGGHGYDVRDYFSVRSDFGTIDDLKELVKEAHARGIKVLLDFVPNHTSSAHRYMQDALEHGKSSSYYGFYDRDDNGNPTHYFDWQNLPNLNYDNPEVWNWIMEAFSYWIRECDIDGFRVDALSDLLPKALIPIVIAESMIEPECPVHQITKEERHRLLRVLKGLPLTVLGTLPLAAAIVTAGGVMLDEVDPRTMASRLVDGLFFGGEVLDLAADTGGFNLQAAFATGHVAGLNAAS
jgi:hypothetical protein